jgi:DNA-binding NarL/FixJ family response regulator
LPGGAEIGEAATGQQALEQVRASRWDMLVLDISLPDLSGLEVFKAVRAERPAMPVLVMSAHPEEQFAVRVMRAGAAGYLTKDQAPEELVGAVAHILAGGRYVGASLADRLATAITESHERPPHESLSDREFQVMQLLAAGKSVTQVANELGLSVKTVSTYRVRLMEKLRLRTNADIIRYALMNELIDARFPAPVDE